MREEVPTSNYLKRYPTGNGKVNLRNELVSASSRLVFWDNKAQ